MIKLASKDELKFPKCPLKPFLHKASHNTLLLSLSACVLHTHTGLGNFGGKKHTCFLSFTEDLRPKDTLKVAVCLLFLCFDTLWVSSLRLIECLENFVQGAEWGTRGREERDVVRLTLKKGMMNWRRGWFVTVWISW